MRAVSTCLILFMAAGATFAQKKDSKFSPGPATSYPNKQTNDNVTVAAVAYDTEDLAHTAFGKLDPNQYGVLPVLVIIQNDTDNALKLDVLEVEYNPATGRHVASTPPGDVQTLGGPEKIPTIQAPRIPLPHKSHKNPLNVMEIEARSFATKLIPSHDSANGFFYFQVEQHRPGATIYLTGIKQAGTNKDVMFFEIPLDM